MPISAREMDRILVRVMGCERRLGGRQVARTVLSHGVRYTGDDLPGSKHMQAAQLQQYDEWLADHLDDLVERYGGKVVAIHEGNVVSVGDTEAEVYRDVRRAGLKPMPLVFRVPREEDVQSILGTEV